MTRIFIKNLPMLMAGVLLGIATTWWLLWGYGEISQIDSLTLFIERSGEQTCQE